MNQRPAIGVALILIGLGLFLLFRNAGVLVDQDLSFEELWPGILVLVGLAFLLQFLLGGTRDPGFVFVGTVALLLGLFFFLFTLNVELPFELENVTGPLDWDGMEYLWPAFPLIGGLAFIAMSLVSREREPLGVGIAAIAVGVIAFAFTLGLAEGLDYLVKYWPAVLIVAGGGLLLRQLVRGR